VTKFCTAVHTRVQRKRKENIRQIKNSEKHIYKNNRHLRERIGDIISSVKDSNKRQTVKCKKNRKRNKEQQEKNEDDDLIQEQLIVK
jgi:hypothetical protein